jgi:hypothetical protein
MKPCGASLQWIARLLANPLLDGVRVMEPCARQRLGAAAANGQTVVLSVVETPLDASALITEGDLPTRASLSGGRYRVATGPRDRQSTALPSALTRPRIGAIFVLG